MERVDKRFMLFFWILWIFLILRYIYKFFGGLLMEVNKKKIVMKIRIMKIVIIERMIL